jgi:acyl-CoA synthetase (AMP-forming)/AMP-acid ligase II
MMLPWSASPTSGWARSAGAFVVRRDDSLQEADVLAHAKATLANYKVPRQVAFVDVLPRNLGGKVLKNELRDQVKQGDTE